MIFAVVSFIKYPIQKCKAPMITRYNFAVCGSVRYSQAESESPNIAIL